MRKVSQVWPQVVFVIAVFTAGCGVDAPATSPTPTPAHGTPSRIELSASSGTGANGGQATVTARVLDAYALLLPDVSVTFGATAGTLSAATVATNSNGVATTTLTADPGTVKVTAVAGGVSAPETQITIQPLNVFVPPPPGPPPPPEQPAPPIPPPPAPRPGYSVSVVASPTSVVTGTPSTLTATVTPLNGAPAVTAWAWDCDTTTASTDFTTANSAACTYATAGTFTASVRVTGGTVVGTATTPVTVTAAAVPSYTVALAASPATIAAGGSTTLTATVTRVNGAPPPSTWAWDCDTTAPTTDSTSAISTACTYPTSGIFIAKVTVTNGSITSSATVDVNVTAAAPSPLTVAIDPVTATIGVAATITGRVSSVGGVPSNALTWEWDFDATTGSTFTTTETGTSPHSTTETYSSIGTKTIRVRVTDPLTGRTATGQRTITVQ